MWESLYPPSPREVVVPLPLRSTPPTLLERLRVVLLYAAVLIPLVWPPLMLASGLYWLWQSQPAFWSWDTLGISALFFMAFGSLRVYKSRWLGRPDDPRSVSRSDQPNLWGYIDQITDDLHACGLDGLIVNSSAACHWFDQMKFPNRLQSRLVLGHWLLESLSLSELKALISIRIARTSGPTWEQRLLRLRLLLELRRRGHDSWSQSSGIWATTGIICWWYSGWPLVLVWLAIEQLEQRWHVPCREDLIANQLNGTDATLLAIAKADESANLIHAMVTFISECATDGFWIENIFTLTTDAMKLHMEEEDRNRWQSLVPPRTPTVARDREWFDIGARYASNFWEGHLPGDDREERIKREYLWNEGDHRPSTLLVDHLPEVRRELTERFYRLHDMEVGDHVTVGIGLLRQWLYHRDDLIFPLSMNHIYDGGRLISPGSKTERETIVLPTDENELWQNLPAMYIEAGTLWEKWNKANRQLADIADKGTRSRKDEIQREHLTRAFKEITQQLSGYDQRLHIVHRQLAAKLDQIDLLEELNRRTENIVRFQPVLSQARNWHTSLLRDEALLREVIRPQQRMLRDISDRVEAALQQLEQLLEWAEQLNLPDVLMLIDQMPLQHFLCTNKILPGKNDRLKLRVQQTLAVWGELRRKADWLHRQMMREMTRTHEQIVIAFADRVEISIS